MGRRSTPNPSRSTSAASPPASLPVIGIVGIAGRYGQWLAKRFREIGHEVIGADVVSGFMPLKRVIKRAEVVIFSVPIDATVSTILECVPFSHRDQLWLDITSLKEPVIAAMLQSKADVIGLHPLCGPDLPNWNGQTVALCYGRLTQPHWETFVLDLLGRLKAHYYVTDPVEHDRIMAYVQALPHALSMIMIGAFERMEQHGLSVSEIEHYATPPYRLAVAAMSRILAAHPELYADIQIANRQHTLEVLRSVHEQAAQLLREVESADRDSVVQRLHRGRQQFRTRNIQSGMKGFLQMSRVMADFSSDNSKVIHTRRDEPGLLEKILAIFGRHGVNLTGLHSFKTDEYDGFSFHFGLEGERNSITLQRAWCEMRNTPELRELIVIEDP